MRASLFSGGGAYGMITVHFRVGSFLSFDFVGPDTRHTRHDFFCVCSCFLSFHACCRLKSVFELPHSRILRWWGDGIDIGGVCYYGMVH